MQRSVLALVLLGLLVVVPAAQAQKGPFVGADLGVSAPTNTNYRNLVDLGAALAPFGGYMFNDYIGAQGQVQGAFQLPNDKVQGITSQTTSVLGLTAGPRLQLPLDKLLSVYGTAQGGYFVGLSGVLAHGAPGFSLGGGIEYKIRPEMFVGLQGRWNRSYIDTSPAVQPASAKGPSEAAWFTGGVSFRYSFVEAEAPPAPPPPPAAAPPPPLPVKKKIVLRAVHFDFNKSTIRPDAMPVLDEAVKLLNEDKDINVLVAGYTDGIGSVPYNLKLSDRRANAVKDYLVSHGVAASRLQVEGFGKSDPVASNDTADGRAQNRRVELKVQ